MDLDPGYTDVLGDPLIRLTLDWTDHEKAQANMAVRVSSELARRMGAKVGEERNLGTRYSVTFYQSTCTCRVAPIMGVSPDQSVVNPWLQHWKMPNLWITGGSTFPQSASGNPTLTILATTYRAADALIDRYLKHPGALA